MWDFSSLISLWINRFYIYLGFAFGFSLWICFQIVIRKQVSGVTFIFKIYIYLFIFGCVESSLRVGFL